VVFDRRLRFNIARQRVLSENGQRGMEGVCDLLDWGPGTRSFARLLHRIPLLGNALVLALITLRTRPMSIPAHATAWWRKRVLQRAQRAALVRRLADAAGRGLA
jgi:hypothetical protein